MIILINIRSDIAQPMIFECNYFRPQLCQFLMMMGDINHRHLHFIADSGEKRQNLLLKFGI